MRCHRWTCADSAKRPTMWTRRHLQWKELRKQGNIRARETTAFFCKLWSMYTYKFWGYSTVGCRRTVCRRTARLEFHLKIRTTTGWKNELRTVSPQAKSVCCEDDFFGGIADFETIPLRLFETFQPHSPPSMRRHIRFVRCKLTYVTRRRNVK